MYIDLLIKIAPLITIVIGLITIIGTYYNRELNKCAALEEKYFNEVLVQYMAKYNENNNINTVKFIKSRYGYIEYFIPPYIFSLAMKNDAKVLHKVLVSDYERGFPSELNCFKNTFKKINDNLKVIVIIIIFFIFYYIAYNYMNIVNNEAQISITKDNMINVFVFVIIMLCILCCIIGAFMWAFKKIILRSLEEENRYTTKHKYMDLQIKSKVRDYEKNISEIDKVRIGFLPNNFHQWSRLIIGIIGVILCCLALSGKITFENMGIVATLVGFSGYIIDGLLSNIKERKDQLNSKQIKGS